MTIIGAGGVVIRRWVAKKRFRREYSKLDQSMQARVDQKIKDLLREPMPPGLGFEKLSGINPPVYTVHVTGNYKISLEIGGDTAVLRRVANHDEIDRQP